VSAQIDKSSRTRVRDLGIEIGLFPTGKKNAITDVDGVMVGHVSLIEGDGPLVEGKGPIRTGVTAILPHPGNVFEEKVQAGVYIMNAFGRATGLPQMQQLGTLETPVLLTNTLNVPSVASYLLEYILEANPDMGYSPKGSANVVVGECTDNYLNDIRSRHVKKNHVYQAIKEASREVQEGSVGAGVGTLCLGFKGGIGTSSRMLPSDLGGFTVGVIVQTNFEGWLCVNGVPVGHEIFRRTGRIGYARGFPYDLGGSCMCIIATDAPLDSRNLERLAKRAPLGLARCGFFGSNGSGDYFIAFSTANKIRYESRRTYEAELLHNDAMSPLFMATVEAAEEAVLNSIFMATTIIGRDNNKVEALPVDLAIEICREFGAIGPK